jgi:hypothetical protein
LAGLCRVNAIWNPNSAFLAMLLRWEFRRLFQEVVWYVP